MMSDDNERDLPGAGPMGRGPKKDKLEIEAEHLSDDLNLGRASDGVDIEQELERALADDDSAATVEEDLNFDFKKKPKSGGSLAKYAAPMLVLLVAAGAAGYIVTHPEIIGRKASVAVATAASVVQKNSNIVLAEADTSQPSQAAAPAQSPPADVPPAGAVVPPPVPGASPASPPDVSATVAPPSPAPAAAAVSPENVAPSADASSPPSAAAPNVVSAPAAGADKSTEGKAAESKAVDAAKPKSDPIKVAQAEVPAAPPALSAPESAKNNEGVSDISRDMGKGTPGDKAPAVVSNDAVPHPDQGKLQPSSASGDALTPPPPPSLDTASVSGVSNAKTAPSDTVKKDREDYYDSNATLPTGQMANAVGPRKVNPSVEPGQKLVVVSGIRKSTDSESMVVSADRALKLGRYDAALDMYNTLYAKNPRDPRILMGRAVAQQNLGQNDQAIDSYDKLLDVVPGNADAMVNMLGLLKQKDPVGALQRMQALQVKFPNHAGLAAQIGLAEGEAGNYDAAMRDLGKAASIEPNNPQHPFNMAVLADRKGDTPVAIKYYELALQADSINANNGGQAIPRDSIYDRLAILRRR